MKSVMKTFFILFLIGAGSLFAQTDSLNIYWNLNPDPDMYSYKLFRAVNGNSNFQIIQNVPHPQAHTVDRYLIQPGNLYAYTLVAMDSAGNLSDFSDTVMVGIPRIDWNLNRVIFGDSIMVFLSDILMDPDHSISQLQVTILNEDHLQISLNGNRMVLVPVPSGYVGQVGFTLRVQDPDSLWDEKSIQFNVGITSSPGDQSGIPADFTIRQNFPNPFNPETNIRYALPKDARVEISVFNTLGQRVKTLINHWQPAGYHSVIWNGTNEAGQPVSSGTYFYSIRAGNYSAVKRMLLLK